MVATVPPGQRLWYGDDAATMNGSMENLKAARLLRVNSEEEILWFRHGGKEYLFSFLRCRYAEAG